jgi:hypothetical protein
MTWHRPRGQRKLAPARLRAPVDPYGAVHKAIRRALLAQLAARGPSPCGICGQDMTIGMRLHLHHPGGLEAKLRGEPGTVLAHAACNLRSGGQDGARVTNASKAAGRATVTPLKPAVRQSRVW